ncbi:MAG: hypothetical protein ACFFC9_05465, partial [Promethearchaeota archaeon]
MRTRNIILIFVASIIVGGGLGFVITGFATYGTIENSFSFYYEGLPSPIEDLDLSADIANLDIQYNTSATPYVVEINVDLKISGLFAAGRKYTNFFAPSTEWWVNTTTPNTFDMKAKPGAWFDPSHWFSSYNVEVVVILRSDLIYNLDAATGTGSIELNTPDNVTLNGVSSLSGTGSINLDFSNGTKLLSDLYLETGTGNIVLNSVETNFTHGIIADAGTGSIELNFNDCIMGYDIFASTGTGGITLNSNNMEYSINCDLSLETGTGKITLLINQDASMGANVTGLLKTGTGNIIITYEDTSSLVGASFFGDTGTGNFNRINSGGFVDPSYNPFDSIDF